MEGYECWHQDKQSHADLQGHGFTGEALGLT
jgi:hypothetical protein